MTKRYREIVSASRDAIICTDSSGQITLFNDAAERLFGYSQAEALGADLSLLLPERFRDRHSAAFERFAAAGESPPPGRVVEMVGLHQSGHEIPIELSLVKTGEDADFEFLGIVRDITNRKQLEDRLEEMSQSDYLTGLRNRHSFDRRLAMECKRAQRHDRRLSLLLADLDRFKDYKNLYGHQAGDKALLAVAECLCGHIRRPDIVARYGEEELAVALPETGHFEALALAEGLLIAVQNLAIAHEGFPSAGILTISIGIASLSENCTGSLDLLRKTDEALALAKARGGNRTATEAELKKPPLWDT